jgi:hypothetical protein
MMIHATQNLVDFGVALNVDTSTSEHDHIENVKPPGGNTQQRAGRIEIETETRCYKAWYFIMLSTKSIPTQHRKEKLDWQLAGGKCCRGFDLDSLYWKMEMQDDLPWNGAWQEL